MNRIRVRMNETSKTIFMLGVVWLLLPPNTSFADSVTLTNGRVVEGEILKDIPGEPLVFRYEWDGQKKTVSVPREMLAAYESNDPLGRVTKTDISSRAEADTEHATVAAPEDIDTTSDLKPLLRSLLPNQTPEKKEVVIVHLRGVFDVPNLHEVGNIISAGEFAVMMELAQERKPEAVVLALDSPGGRIDQMDKIVEQILEAQAAASGTRVVAWVELGGSAAAITALCCKEIVMRPHGRMGSATMVFGDGTEVPDAKSAMDHKIAAMREARRRQVADLTGRPEAVQLAMEEPQKQLWHHPKHGFSSTVQKAANGWKAYDASEDAPLALAAHECVELEIAKGTASDTAELCKLLEVAPNVDVVHIDLGDQSLQNLLLPARQKSLALEMAVAKETDRFNQRLLECCDRIQVAIRACDGIMSMSRGYSDADLAQLRRAISSCRIPPLRKSFRESLEEWDPMQRVHYDAGLAQAKRLLRRANQSSQTLPSTLPAGAIRKDLALALRWTLYGPFRGTLLDLSGSRD